MTGSLLTGAAQLSRFSGLADEPTLLNAVPVVSDFVPRACSVYPALTASTDTRQRASSARVTLRPSSRRSRPAGRGPVTTRS